MDMRTIAVTLLLAGSLLAPAALGAEEPDRLAQIVEQQRELQQDLDTIEGITKRQRNAIRKAQSEVFALTEGKSRLDELSIDEKVRLDNALERINAQLLDTRAARAEADDCRRERRSGTHLESTQCATVEQRDRLRENSRTMLEKRHVSGVLER